jgi:chromosomal replication initiation ATPase DnaA
MNHYIPTETERKVVNDIIEKAKQDITNAIGRTATIILRLKVNHLNPELIIQQVCTTCKVTWSQVVNKGREREYVTPRHLICWLITHYCGLTPDKIAQFIHRDRTTVLYAIENVNNMLDTNNPMYVHPLVEIEKLLLNIVNDAA